MRTCIALDIGRSAVKMIAVYDAPENGQRQRLELSFKSAFSKAISLTEQLAIKGAEADTVVVNEVPYFVGDTAISQGQDDMLGGLTDDWVFDVQHTALLLSALKRLTSAGVPGVDNAVICLGLPTHLYDSQHKQFAAGVSKLAPLADIKVIQQAMGPYYAMLLDETGNEHPGLAKKSWAIIEVGQFTTDFALIDHGVAIQRSFGSCAGMSVAAENLQKEIQNKRDIRLSFVEATDTLASHEIQNFGEMIDVSSDIAAAVEAVAEMIVNKSQQTFGAEVRTLNGICLAGGGADLIRSAIATKWSKTATGKSVPPSFILVASNARFAVAEGFCRFALSLDIKDGQPVVDECDILKPAETAAKVLELAAAHSQIHLVNPVEPVGTTGSSFTGEAKQSAQTQAVAWPVHAKARG